MEVEVWNLSSNIIQIVESFLQSPFSNVSQPGLSFQIPNLQEPSCEENCCAFCRRTLGLTYFANEFFHDVGNVVPHRYDGGREPKE